MGIMVLLDPAFPSPIAGLNNSNSKLIQTQMAQKPMLRAEVYAHAMRASQNRKKEVRGLNNHILQCLDKLVSACAN